MLAFLIDEKGNAIERLNDIPIILEDEEKMMPYWRFKVAPTKSGCGYDVTDARISDFVIENGARIRVFTFTNISQHQAILDYIGK